MLRSVNVETSYAQAGSSPAEGTKFQVCQQILRGMEANDTFMDSIMQEHKCVRKYYAACEDVRPISHNILVASYIALLQAAFLIHENLAKRRLAMNSLLNFVKACFYNV